MLESLTYKKKNQLLIVIAIFLGLLIYFVSIKRTISAFKDYSKNIKLYETASNSPVLLKQLHSEVDDINAKLRAQNSVGEQYSEKLIELITNYCQSTNSILKEFPKTEIAQKDDLVIETNKFTLAGDYITLLKFVYLLEQKNRLGKIVSVNYSIKKDYKSNGKILTVTIYLQNIKKKSNEK